MSADLTDRDGDVVVTLEGKLTVEAVQRVTPPGYVCAFVTATPYGTAHDVWRLVFRRTP